MRCGCRSRCCALFYGGIGPNADDFIDREVDTVTDCGFHHRLASPVRYIPLGVPALNRAWRHTEFGGHRPDAPEFLEDAALFDAIAGNVHKPHRSRTLHVRQSHYASRGDFRTMLQMDESGIREALRRLGVPHVEIGKAFGGSRDAATRFMNDRRRLKVDERQPLLQLVSKYEQDAGESQVVRHLRNYEDEFQAGLLDEYVSVEILPTYAGMGGGGTGDDDRRRALLPRTLVEGDLRAKPEDVLIIPVRGTSMEPEFYQGDQVVVDRRDKDTHQAGPFALLYDGTYVLKNVERVPRTSRVRIFSSNSIFSDREEEMADVEIVGRPVWFARRL